MNIKTILAAVMMLAVSSVLADKVTLKSGSFLTGTAGVFADGKLKFTSDELGELAIPVDKIAKLEASNDHVVQYNDRTLETKKVTVTDGAYVVVENGAEKKLDMTNVKAVDPVIEKWHGSVNFSGTVTRGNTVGESASVVADVSRRWEKDRVTASAGYYYGASGDSKDTKQKTTSRFELQAQEDHFWTGESFYTYVNGKYEYDRILNLKYRYRLGLGLGYQWFEKKDFGFGKSSFNQELGITYILEKYDGMEEEDYGTFRYAHHFVCDIDLVPGLAFAHNFEFLPQVDEWTDNYLFDADFGFTYAFLANWQLIAKVEWDYQKQVAPGRKNSDLRYIFGLGYKW